MDKEPAAKQDNPLDPQSPQGEKERIGSFELPFDSRVTLQHAPTPYKTYNQVLKKKKRQYNTKSSLNI